ncbi:MAG: hypothetical protein ACOYN4_06325 [Bacteroidales bacterium]
MQKVKTKAKEKLKTSIQAAPVLKNNFPGYPAYPVGEDLYEKFHQEKDINPEDISEAKIPNPEFSLDRVKNFNENVSGSDLDVPGAELDDDLEKVGSEDEENNYYSLGGDDHADLDENNIT